MTIELLESFLGWCLAINFSLLVIASLAITVMKEQIISIHQKFLTIESSKLNVLYFDFLGRYKLIIISFNLVPYIALNLI